MLTSLRAAIGRIWGATTTIALAVGVAVMSVPIPPEMMTPQVKSWTFGIAVLIAVLRAIAPPQKA